MFAVRVRLTKLKFYDCRRQFPPPPMTSPIIPAWQKSTLHEDQPQFSPLNLKPEGVNNETGNAVNGSEENTVSELESLVGMGIFMM